VLRADAQDADASTTPRAALLATCKVRRDSRSLDPRACFWQVRVARAALVGSYLRHRQTASADGSGCPRATERGTPRPAASSARGAAVRVGASGRRQRALARTDIALPVQAVSPPAARQLLPETLGWEEVQATADLQAVHAVVDRAAQTTARPVRPLAVGSRVLTAGEKSPVTGDCHAGIRGSRGLRCPRRPDRARFPGRREARRHGPSGQEMGPRWGHQLRVTAAERPQRGGFARERAAARLVASASAALCAHWPTVG
jgi:hypothetical protein